MNKKPFYNVPLEKWPHLANTFIFRTGRGPPYSGLENRWCFAANSTQGTRALGTRARVVLGEARLPEAMHER